MFKQRCAPYFVSCLGGLLLTASQVAACFAEDLVDYADGRHRLDLSVTALDAREANIYTFLPAYTYTLGRQIRIGVTGRYNKASIADDDLAEFLDPSGFGDTDLHFQYTPSPELSSSPWIPDTLGLSAGLTIPTGEKGYGGTSWSYRVGLGWAFPLTESLFLLPTVEYEDTFSEDRDFDGVTTYGGGLGLQWVAANGFWAGYTPYLERDSVFSEWADDHSLIVGKMWPNGFGLSLEYGQRRRIDRTAVRDDYTGLLNIYYQFGLAP